MSVFVNKRVDDPINNKDYDLFADIIWSKANPLDPSPLPGPVSRPIQTWVDPSTHRDL